MVGSSRLLRFRIDRGGADPCPPVSLAPEVERIASHMYACAHKWKSIQVTGDRSATAGDKFDLRSSSAVQHAASAPQAYRFRSLGPPSCPWSRPPPPFQMSYPLTWM